MRDSKTAPPRLAIVERNSLGKLRMYFIDSANFMHFFLQPQTEIKEGFTAWWLLWTAPTKHLKGNFLSIAALLRYEETLTWLIYRQLTPRSDKSKLRSRIQGVKWHLPRYSPLQIDQCNWNLWLRSVRLNIEVFNILAFRSHDMRQQRNLFNSYFKALSSLGEGGRRRGRVFWI